MCGIAGFVDPLGKMEPSDLRGVVSRMSAELRHRGPDHVGVWTEPAGGVALGHTRLSILDLSPEGHQPMISSCGRFVISFNGEIYNFRALREELKELGHVFRSHSDTEVLLCAITRWGLDTSLPRLNGMFAFALWDRVDKTLHLVRDRLGEKPLYYGWAGRFFIFGSELKALQAHPASGREINREALAQFMQFGYVPGPLSIYRNIFKLPPATQLSLQSGSNEISLTKYWSLEDAALRGAISPWQGSTRDATDHLDDLLRDAVRLRMESDVPLGAFLSGGIDSSIVVAMMQAQSVAPVKTFTVGFREHTHDESQYAKSVARHLGTDHTELVVTSKQALELVPALPRIYDEPFADNSQIPTCLIARLARRQVTVALSGDGGDEVFAGYRTYRWGARVHAAVGWLPDSLRGSGAAVLSGASNCLPGNPTGRRMAGRFRALSRLLKAAGAAAFYRTLISTWHDPNEVVIGAGDYCPAGVPYEPPFPNLWHRMMYTDTLIYLPDDILVKVDRASMNVGLECRIPLLDHRVLEFAWKLPLGLKVQDGQGKRILRQVLSRYAPAEWFNRPKMGFSVPLGDWLRGPLRDWAQNLLDEDRLKQEGFLRPGPVVRKWTEHLAGRQSWTGQLWTVLMFQSWLEEQRAVSPTVVAQARASVVDLARRRRVEARPRRHFRLRKTNGVGPESRIVNQFLPDAIIPIVIRLRKYWPILAYHSISDSRSDGLSLSPKEFEDHLKFFRRRGYESATVQDFLEEIARENATPQRKIIITFDDGYADNYEYALPLLKKYGYSATFFLVTSLIGTNQLHHFDSSKPAQGLGPASAYRSMDWSQVRELVANGMQIGSHTCSHLALDRTTPDSVLQSEIVNSKLVLETQLNVAIDLFCYPRGKLEARAVRILQSAGYRAAVLTPHLRDEICETRYSLKRVGMYRSNLMKFRLKLTPWFFRLRTNGAFRW